MLTTRLSVVCTGGDTGSRARGGCVVLVGRCVSSVLLTGCSCASSCLLLASSGSTDRVLWSKHVSKIALQLFEWWSSPGF